MLNLLWAVMMAAGLIWGAFHGTLGEVTNGALEAAREAVTLGITMLEIGRKSGLMEALARKMYPILHMLFPRIPRDHPALESICANVTANLLGLGWAATPAGLKAMGDLKALEEERRRQRDVRAVKEGTANDEMCAFLIINISSLQLIPMTMIAYRAQYGSANPAAVTGPALLATSASTLAAVVFCAVKMRGTGTRENQV